MGKFDASRAQAVTRDRTPALPAGRLGVRATRSSMTAAGWPTQRSTTTRRAATVTAFTAARAGLLPRARRRRRAADDRQRVHLHPQPRRCASCCDARAIRHIRTRPYTPRTNGKVERYQQTLQREWAYALEYASSDARRASLPHWVRHYNERRTHSALGNRPPLIRVREVTGLNS